MTSQLNVDTIGDKAGSGGSNVKMANTSTYVSDGGSATQAAQAEPKDDGNSAVRQLFLHVVSPYGLLREPIDPADWCSNRTLDQCFRNSPASQT